MFSYRGLTIILSTLLFFSSAVSALTTQERDLAWAAGEYYAAILLAREFKKTRCGQISIDQKWTDTNRARRELRAKFPAHMKKDIDNDKDWATFEKTMLQNVQKVIDSLNSPKFRNVDCKQIQGVFWESFNTAVTRWERF